MACRKLDVLNLDGGHLCALLALHAAAQKAGTVDEEEVLANEEVLREAVRTVDLGRADILPMTQRAEIALFEPQSDTLRVVRVPAK